jgi:hypothetical protein
MTQQINLYDASLRPVHDWATAPRILATAGLLALLAMGHVSWERHALARAIADAPPAAPEVLPDAAIEADITAANARIERDERLLQAMSGLTDLPPDNAERLQSLFAAMPATLWLDSVEFSGRQGVRIAGGATDSAALADYAQRLAAQPAFRELALQLFSLGPLTLHYAAVSDESTPIAAPKPAHGFVLSSLPAEATAPAAEAKP